MDKLHAVKCRVTLLKSDGMDRFCVSVFVMVFILTNDCLYRLGLDTVPIYRFGLNTERRGSILTNDCLDR